MLFRSVVEPDDVRKFLAPLDVSEIHGVGPVTARKLRGMGLETAGDVADADPRELKAAFDSRGRELYDRARGEDDREVTPTGRPKSLSRESAFTEATDDDERKRDQILTLAEAVADRASRKGAMYRTIGVKAVTPPYDVNTRAKSLPGPVDDPELVEEVALELCEEFEGVEVRKVGVRVSNLSFADADQASLGDGWGAAAVESAVSASDGDSPDEDARKSGDDDNAGEDGDGADTGSASVESGTLKLTDIPADGGDDRSDATDRRAGDGGTGNDGGGDAPDLSGQSSLEAGWEQYQPANDSDDGATGANEEESSGSETAESGSDGDSVSESEADSESASDSDLDGQVSLGDFE